MFFCFCKGSIQLLGLPNKRIQLVSKTNTEKWNGVIFAKEFSKKIILSITKYPLSVEIKQHSVNNKDKIRKHHHHCDVQYTS